VTIRLSRKTLLCEVSSPVSYSVSLSIGYLLKFKYTSLKHTLLVFFFITNSEKRTRFKGVPLLYLDARNK